jgi:hypothetical protein
MQKGGCTKTLDVKVTIEHPHATVSKDSIVACNGSQIILNGSGSTGIANLPNLPTWTVKTAVLSDSNRIAQFAAVGLSHKWYYLNIDGDYGCNSRDSVFVNVVDSINNIHGTATHDHGKGPIAKGYLLLYKNTSAAKGVWPAIDSIQLKSNGTYALVQVSTLSGFTRIRFCILV